VPAATFIPVLLAGTSLALFLQASLEVWRMMYSYREPESIERLKFPVPNPNAVHEKFCLIVPARHEAAVLGHTLSVLAGQTHPNVDIISVMCDDDLDTLEVAHAAAAQYPRIRVMAYPLAEGVKPSKPLQLNYVLDQTVDEGYSVVGIIDAEDTVHPELLVHVEAAFQESDVDIVQGGVQLMNHDSSWYSLHNVLEYYRWFNSAMAYNADKQFMPLGGNTIFIRDALVRKAGGWPETLTEDCSLGVLLSTRYQAKTAVYYDPRLATREETPDSLTGLFKQRVRWNQGFFHEWRRGIWHELPTFRQRLLAGYVLLGPLLMALISIFMVVSLLAIFFLNAPVGLAMLMYAPIIPAGLLAILNGLFLYDFGKAFGRKIRFRHYVVLFSTQIVYQVVLNAAALWSVVRELRGDTSWYKTPHSGLHREQGSASSLQPAYAATYQPMSADTMQQPRMIYPYNTANTGGDRE
jgi:cellulose synthase/poly-beta-1,6-N-acetylglucosamine synthase-like glycosyltransferase